jgi:hypothetical protein
MCEWFLVLPRVMVSSLVLLLKLSIGAAAQLFRTQDVFTLVDTSVFGVLPRVIFVGN